MVFESWYSPVRSRDGTVDGVIGVGTDITKRRRVEEALRRSEERHGALVQHASHAIYRSSPDDRGGIGSAAPDHRRPAGALGPRDAAPRRPRAIRRGAPRGPDRALPVCERVLGLRPGGGPRSFGALLNKPWTTSDLLGRVREILDREADALRGGEGGGAPIA